MCSSPLPRTYGRLRSSCGPTAPSRCASACVSTSPDERRAALSRMCPRTLEASEYSSTPRRRRAQRSKQRGSGGLSRRVRPRGRRYRRAAHSQRLAARWDPAVLDPASRRTPRGHRGACLEEHLKSVEYPHPPCEDLRREPPWVRLWRQRLLASSEGWDRPREWAPRWDLPEPCPDPNPFRPPAGSRSRNRLWGPEGQRERPVRPLRMLRPGYPAQLREHHPRPPRFRPRPFSRRGRPRLLDQFHLQVRPLRLNGLGLLCR